MDDVRPVAAGAAGAAPGAVGVVAAARCRAHAVVSLRGQLESPGPAGDGLDRPAPGPGLPACLRVAGGMGGPDVAPGRGRRAWRGRDRVARLARAARDGGGPIRARPAL